MDGGALQFDDRDSKDLIIRSECCEEEWRLDVPQLPALMEYSKDVQASKKYSPT